MKILITGGCGFLGSNLACHYLLENSDVTIIDALYREGSHENLNWLKNLNLKSNLNFVEADVSDHEEITKVFAKYGPFDYVIHVAGQVAMTKSLKDPTFDFKTNVVGTFNILEAIREFSPESFLAFSSTNKVYGDLEWLKYKETDYRYIIPEFPNGLSEKLPLDFSTPYGCSKGSADQYVRDWSRTYGLKTVVFRHSSIYGGRQFASKDQGWIGWFCNQILQQKKNYESSIEYDPFTISGNGKQVRDVLHAQDLVNLYKIAYEKKDLASGKIFNIGGGVKNSLSILELINLLKKYLEFEKVKYLFIQRRKSDQDYFVADITKAKKILGWEPNLDLKKGIEQMIIWSKSYL